MVDVRRSRLAFLALFAVVSLAKLVVAAGLPLFVDEAFYWQEGQHLALAYSDLPGLTAWLARLGVEIGGNALLALRAPFLLLAAFVPLLVVRIASREFSARDGWVAGCFALLLPLGFAQAQAGELDFHQFTQWLAAVSLSQTQQAARGAGMRIGLIADLAIGASPAGSPPRAAMPKPAIRRAPAETPSVDCLVTLA